MKMNSKYYSKLHKGFNKMIIRQESKPSEVVIELPIAIKLPKNFKGEYVHRITIQNSVWNGMNLKQLRNRLQPIMPDWFGSHRTVNKNGRYSLSLKGKQYLKKKKAKQQGINTTK